MGFLAISEIIPPASVLPYAGGSAPSGWLLCNGSAISRTTYAALFAAIGTSHGSGDGSTTFNLPDYRGRFLRGVASGQATDPDRASRSAMAVGGNTGDAVGSVQDSQFGSHGHGLYGNSASGGTFNLSSASGVMGIGGGGTGYAYYSGPPFVNTNGGNETRPTNANVNYIIKI